MKLYSPDITKPTEVNYYWHEKVLVEPMPKPKQGEWIELPKLWGRDGEVQTMSKYIDVEWLKQNFNTVFWSQITKTIDSAPSIDICFCRECKWLRYCETEDLNMFLDCDHPDGGGIPRSEDWFCADGEREGE